ncbi:MAG: hypothetical protein JNG88_10035 [Phycisphaerales bacterium]|nr:hypothetical protein [Phycisphaerales bacterium]
MFSKIVRENSRALVLVVMSLLLVTFLLSDVINSCSDSSGRARDERLGTAFASAVYTSDVQRADDKIRIAREAGIMPGELAGRIDPLDFHLLVTEAKRAGVYVGRNDLQREFEQNPMIMQRLDELRSRYHLSLDAIYGVIGDWLAVMNFWQIQRDALGASVPRAELAYRNQQQQASVALSVIDAKALISTIPDPTEAELAEFFEQAKNRMTQHTEDKVEFGYKYPDRVQIEYVTVDPKSLQDAVQVRTSEVKRFFETNAKRYEQRVPKPTTQPADPSQPAPQPEFDIIMPSFEEVQERVREDARADKAVQEGQRIINQIRDRLSAPWAGIELGADGYHPAPPADKIESLEAICASMAASGVPVAYKKTELVDATGLQREGGVAMAAMTASNQQIRLQDLMLRVKGLYTPKTEEGQREIFPVLNILEPSPVMIWSRMNPAAGRVQQAQPYQAYLFRVIQVAPSAPPDSIDLVRDKVKADWKTVQAYKKAEEFAKKLADRAKEIGIDGAATEMTELREILTQADAPPTTQPGEFPAPKSNYLAAYGPVAQDKFPRSQRFIPNVGVSPNLHKRIFEIAELSSESPPPAHRVVLVSMGQTQRWIVGELREVRSLYQGDFDVQREQLQRRTGAEEDNKFYAEWFDSAGIRARAGFVAANAAK